MEDLTDTQRKALKEFKEYLADVLTPDYTDTVLIKWLRARNYNTKAAEKIFRETYNNRILFGINTILDTYRKPEVLDKYESIGVIGFAKDGCLIRYVAAGRVDFYGFIMSLSCYELCHYLSYIMESDVKALKEENIRTGRNVEEVLYVIDLEEFSLQQVFHKNVIEMGMDSARLLQDCYPEIWSHILVVNAPGVFDVVFRTFKPVLRGPILEKLKVANKDSTKSLLLEYIDEDVLPAFLGGKRVDSNGDPECKEFIKFGQKVPEKFYSQNRSSANLLASDDPKTRTFVLGPGSVRNIGLPINQGGTICNIKMKAENGSVGMSIFYKEFGEDPKNPDFPGDDEYLDEHDEKCRFKMISVSMRPQIHCTPMDIQAFCLRPGIYIVRLSNAGSWFTTRKVMIQYDVVLPKIESSTEPEDAPETSK